MYAAALLLATAAVGVDTGWQPAQDDPQSVQYIIQIEPEVLQKMLRDGTPIDSIVPPDVPGGVIRCFRVQLGEDELPREMPAVAKAGYNAEIENDNATLHKMVEAEPLALNPAPDNRSAASTAAPALDTLAQSPTPRYSSALSPGGSTFPSSSAGAGTPLNPTTRTANAADANPSLSGTGSSFSIPGGSTTTPVRSSTPSSRFAPSTPATSTPTANSARSSTYPRSGSSNTPTSNPSSEYPQYTSPPLNTPTRNDTVPLGGTSNGGNSYGRFSDSYATPGSSNNYSPGQSGANNSGNLTPINSTPPSANNNPQNNNNGGNYTPPSNNQQQQPPNNNNNYQQPGNNYQQPPQQQQPYPQQPPVPYSQPGYVNTFQPNPYMPNMGYPPQYNPYLAALPGFGAPALTPPAQQQPAAQTPPPAAQPPAPSPSDRPARDLEEEPTKPAEPVERPYWMLVIVAFLSLGFNIYMGWMVVDFRTKYRDILAGFRELKAAN
ncbi:hypothetical protein [Blastopirellula retiformator]|uniref:Uncharacterized protein n=1 Tax=Blastopirellula retiformator TaxID=2527970 RepID=A0A5C5UW41_9BACT|nr:hypothetical protein [Blastopirellula retiformator]TWT29843.1 hypothetical protein Enr8_44990 [Blastopirellula retiformator]